MIKFKLFFTFVAAALVTLDQIIKKWALETLRPVRSITVIPGLFNLSYVENRGAAFGIMQDSTTLLSVITCVVLLAAVIWLYGKRIKSKTLSAFVFIIISGGIGNLIDRVSRGFVIDYLDFSALFGFPVFNMADCCVVVGTFALIIYTFASERKAAADSYR